MDAELKNLQIDRTRRPSGPSRWATAWIIIGVLLLVGLGAWELLSGKLDSGPVVEVRRVTAVSAASARVPGRAPLASRKYAVRLR